MRIASIFITSLLLLLNTSVALTQDIEPSPIVVPGIETFDLTSETNGHDYRLWIGLPENYTTSEESYAVLYLLDPGISFLTATEILRFHAWGDEAYPKVMVVGIGYPTTNVDEIIRLRERDYSRQDDDFLKFIDEELIPLIDSNYRTDTTDRALVDWSYGGDFAFYALTNRPDLFNRYIAIDPSPQELTHALVNNEDAFRASFDGLNVKIFISTVGTEVLAASINRREIEGLEAIGLSLGNATHGDALHLTLVAGLIAIYRD